MTEETIILLAFLFGLSVLVLLIRWPSSAEGDFGYDF